MYTPAQLRDRLLELGIDRDLRTLTDWRQKGLMPPLQRIGSGRGRGVQRLWSDAVLDQAIAVDWLISRSGRADETLLGLWLSGYPVDPTDARKAWLQTIRRVQDRRVKEASRSRSGFVGLGRKWSRMTQTSPALSVPWWQERSSGDRKAFSDLLGDVQEWLRDDAERDDDAFRYQIAELIVRFFRNDQKHVYELLDKTWKEIDPASFLAISPYLRFVESMSLDELNAAHASLTLFAAMLQHVGELFGTSNRISAIVFRILLMDNFFGSLLARILVKAARERPELPLQATISAVHDWVIRVQLSDIIKNNDGITLFSDRAKIEWESTKKCLLQLWIPMESP